MKVDKITIHKLMLSDSINDSRLRNSMGKIMKETWGEPGTIVDNWLSLADIMFVAKDGDRIIAFSIGNFISKKVLNLTATVVHKEYQGHGLSQIMNQKIIKYFSLMHALRFIFFGFYIVFRTTNPLLYESVYKKIKLFPDYLDNRLPTDKEQEVFSLVIDRFCSNSDTDNKNFIIKDGFRHFPGLMYRPNDIPFAKNDNVNKFFEKRLGLSRRQGRIMVVVGKINITNILRGVFR